MAPRPADGFDPQRILFHGSGLLVIDKPAGIPVHRGTGHQVGLLEQLSEWISLHPRLLEARPGKRIHPIHLMDLEASGVLLLGLTKTLTRMAKEAYAAGSVERRYLAVVAGPLMEEGSLRGKVRSKLRGKYRLVEASLDFRRLRGDERLSLVEVVPRGGPTHVVRSLFAQAGRPLAGDLRYGKPAPARKFLEKFGMPHLLLHAHRVTLPDGILGGTTTFEAPLPRPLERLLEQKGWEGKGEIEG